MVKHTDFKNRVSLAAYDSHTPKRQKQTWQWISNPNGNKNLPLNGFRSHMSCPADISTIYMHITYIPCMCYIDILIDTRLCRVGCLHTQPEGLSSSSREGTALPGWPSLGFSYGAQLYCSVNLCSYRFRDPGTVFAAS